MIKVDILPVLKDNYVYILHTPNFCAIVDPGEAKPVFDYCHLKNLKPDFILNTHHHGDHVAGNTEIKNHFGCQIIGPAKEADKIRTLDIKLKAGEQFSLGDETALILAAEGHTAGGIMYHFPQSKLLFVGDTLFSMGCGRLFEGTPEQMFSALQSIATLSDDTQIFCGHEYTLINGEFCLTQEPENQDILNRIAEVKSLREAGKPSLPTTVGLEKKTNLFLQSKSAAEFAALREKRNKF